MTSDPGSSKQRLYLVAGTGIVLQLAGIFLMLARDLSVAVVAPLLIIGMFMTFAPAIVAKRDANP